MNDLREKIDQVTCNVEDSISILSIIKAGIGMQKYISTLAVNQSTQKRCEVLPPPDLRRRFLRLIDNMAKALVTPIIGVS